jgi:hypothetical protein
MQDLELYSDATTIYLGLKTVTYLIVIMATETINTENNEE